jgi:hypothetical protein
MEPPFCFGMTKPYNHYGATIIIMEWSDHNGLGIRPLVPCNTRAIDIVINTRNVIHHRAAKSTERRTFFYPITLEHDYLTTTQ